MVLWTCSILLTKISDGEIDSGAELTSWIFQMGFNIIAPYIEFLHMNWYIAEWNIMFSGSKCSDGELQLFLVLRWVSLPGISILPALEINFSNKVETK